MERRRIKRRMEIFELIRKRDFSQILPTLNFYDDFSSSPLFTVANASMHVLLLASVWYRDTVISKQQREQRRETRAAKEAEEGIKIHNNDIPCHGDSEE